MTHAELNESLEEITTLIAHTMNDISETGCAWDKMTAEDHKTWKALERALILVNDRI